MPLLKLLLKRLLGVYCIYFISRVLFYIFNYSYFSHFSITEIIPAFIFGLRFDTTSIIYSNSIIILLHLIPVPWKYSRVWQQVTMWLFLIINTCALLMNLIDTGYFPFSGKRSGAELFALQKDIADQSLTYVTDYWYLTILLAGAVWVMYKLYPRFNEEQTPYYGVKTFATDTAILIAACAVCFIGARGSTGLKPLNVLDAARLTRSELAALTLNTPFQLIMTVQQTGVQEKHFMTEAEAARIVNPLHEYKRPATSHKNIVLIIVESLGKEYMGYYNNGKGYTPFLDSLAMSSHVYMHAYANGKRSIEGIPSIVASMPSLMDNDYMNSYYQTNTLRSTGSFLKEMGYNTSFYHGGKNGTMSFDNFIAVTDAGEYFGLNEYPDKKDDDGNWGIYDEPYLQYFAQQLNAKPAPFFATVFTLSSHHPYNLPADKKAMFPEGTLPIHKTIRYADYALKRFFETAKQMPWYDSTIFIITADHSSNNEQNQYNSTEGIYRIPLIVFDPSAPHHMEIPVTIQQIDLMPGILGYCGYPGPFFSFGSNVHRAENPGFAVQYVNGQYQLIQYPYVLHFDGDRTTGFFVINSKGEMDTASNDKQKASMELLIKALIQQYNAALIHNKTAVGN
jgi:phosphoglycerol transferase MdoB-like AlkP superfamily enzyme